MDANTLFALAGIITAIGGAVATIIQSFRATSSQRQSAAENALAINNEPKHRLEVTPDAPDSATPQSGA